MNLDGSDFYNNSDFILMDQKGESNIVGSILGENKQKTAYYEVSSDAKSMDSEFDFYYVGKIKDNRPNGDGALFLSTYTGVHLLYAGGFKDGKTNGTGIMLNSTWFGYDILESGTYEKNLLNGKGIRYKDDDITGVYNAYNDMLVDYSNGSFATYSKDKQEEIIKRIIKRNPACRMQLVEKLYELDSKKAKINVPVVKPIDGFVGKFKEGEYQDGKEYDYFGILVYDGEFKNGEYSGSGTLYYDGSSSIKYKGKFRNGNYNGKGVLYNKDGNVRKKAEFKNEKPATEQEEMAYSLSSSITIALYTTKTEKGVEYFFEPEGM